MKLSWNLMGSRTCVSPCWFDWLWELCNIVLEFGHLFVELFEDTGDLWPIESAGGSLATQFRGLKQRGHGPGYPAKERAIFSLGRQATLLRGFSFLKGFPIADNFA